MAPLTYRIAVLLYLTLATGEAMASGGLSCEASDSNIQLGVLADIARNTSMDVFSPQGELSLKLKGLVSGWRSFNLQNALVQNWIYEDDLRLHLSLLPQGLSGISGIDLIIKTTRNGQTEDGEQFTGSYTLLIYSSTSGGPVVTTKGDSSCELN